MPVPDVENTNDSGLNEASPRREIVDRIVGRVKKAPGSAPGTLVHTGERKVEAVRIRFLDYDPEELREKTVDDIDSCFPFLEAPTVTWVNIDGLHEPEIIRKIGDRFGFHPLMLEDVLSLGQRPKVEEFEDHFFMVVKMLTFDEKAKRVIAEQVSLIVGDRYVFSFQERFGDVFEPVRERIRHGKGRIRVMGADYLAYALIDAIVDRYFQILEEVGNHIEELEELVLTDPTVAVMHRIHHLKRELLILRRSVWPLREALGGLSRGEIPSVQERTQVFFRDVYDHAVQVIDTVETLREVNSSAMDLYMSSVSNRMNEVMKVLTVIATIFIPLSFFAGVYGMNFEYMPELRLRWAYPVLLVAMFSVGSGMLLYFRRRGWF